MNMMDRIKKVYILTIALVALTITAPALATADSNLSQVIRYIDCSHVTLETADQMNHPDCPVFPPKFMKLDLVNEKYPVIYGIYDAVHTVTNPSTGKHDLVVEFNGRTFVLGRDKELRVNGNAWTLDFSHWQTDRPGDGFMPLQPGATYHGRVTTKTQAHAAAPVITSSADFSITIPDNRVIPSVTRAIRGFLADTGNSLWLAIAGGSAAIIIAFILLLIRKKRKGGG